MDDRKKQRGFNSKTNSPNVSNRTAHQNRGKTHVFELPECEQRILNINNLNTVIFNISIDEIILMYCRFYSRNTDTNE